MNKANINNCTIVQDLLPLYYDNVCSEESKELVREHITECPTCRKIADELNNKNSEKRLRNEAGNVLKRHARRETKKSAIVGGVVAGILMISLIVCLIWEYK